MTYEDSECWNCPKEIKEDKPFWSVTICDEELNNLMKFCSKKCAKEFIGKNLKYERFD